jgi:hypothetical protein
MARRSFDVFDLIELFTHWPDLGHILAWSELVDLWVSVGSGRKVCTSVVLVGCFSGLRTHREDQLRGRPRFRSCGPRARVTLDRASRFGPRRGPVGGIEGRSFPGPGRRPAGEPS